MVTADRRDDESLWQEFVAGRDERLLAELYDRYLSLVYGVALKYLQDREEARDAAMEIFEKLLRTDKGQQIEKFRIWLYVVTKNHCLMKLRAKASLEKKAAEAFMEFSEQEHPLDSDGQERTPALLRCLGSLKPEQQACVTLFYFEKKSYLEIAATEGIEVKEVKSHIQNGKRNLKICIERHDE